MNFNKLYIPISSVNLGHYFAKGCICSVNILKERNPDIQNKFDSGILLCKRIHTDETDCSIEVQLSQEEIQKYSKEISVEFLFYQKFIPISRVSKIIFKRSEQAKTTIYDVNQARAFIPNELVEINDNNVAQFKDINLIQFETNNEELLDKYNRLLGGFALMRLGKKQYQNYPINYYSTLSRISSPIKAELQKNPNPVLELMNDNYAWLIAGNGKYKNLYDITYSKISEQTFFDFAKEDGAKYETKLGRIDLDSIDKNKNSYLIAILASYNNKGTRRTLDNFIEDLNYDKFPIKRKEGISLMFGINKGYDAFRNCYKTDNFVSTVKFKLNTILDYYIIESVYQYVMSLDIENNFSYIFHTKINKADKNKYNTYSLFSNDIIYEEKKSKNSIWEKLKHLFFSEIIYRLTNSFEHKIGFELLEEQKSVIGKELENLLSTPLSNFFQEIEAEQSQLRDTLSNKEKEINELKTQKNYLWENLREINSSQFALLDTDHDKILNNDELKEYVKFLKSLTLKSSDVTNSYVDKDYLEEHNAKGDYFDFPKREIELNKISLKELMEIAKQYKIKNYSKYKKDNKYQLVRLILNEERSISSLGL